MSTKGLQEHKKVEGITLNDQGKAATLTLKAPWLFEGQRGPFILKNVSHGHDITKGAYDERKGPKAPSTAPSAPEPRAPGVLSPFGSPVAAPPAPVGPSYVREAAEPLALPDRAFLVWRGMGVSQDRDIMFWFFTYRRTPLVEIERAGRAALTSWLKGKDMGGAPQYDIYVKEHSVADEAHRQSPFNHLRETLGSVT